MEALAHRNGLARNAWISAVAFAAVVSMPCAHALSQRTFVASTGDDGPSAAAGCTLAQPCRSFAAAMAHTLFGGEVVVLDSAGYGPVTISQSVAITAPAGVYAGISVLTASGDGVVVAGAGIDVVLR